MAVDFPRIPHPETTEQFWNISQIGGQLRKLHLMENLPKMITQFNIAGSNNVDNIKVSEVNEQGNIEVWINDTQYFDNVPF